MNLIRLAVLTALILGQVSTSLSQSHDVPVTPVGPATIGPPLTTLSFDTTASVSLLSALSSLISSESTAINPFTSYSFSPTATGASVTSGTDSGTPTATGPTTTQSVATTTPTSTSTNGAGHAVSPSGGVLVAIVVAVAALL